jgi:outer membrane protein
MNVIRDAAIVELQKQNVEAVRSCCAPPAIFNVGEVTRTDVAQAESRLAALNRPSAWRRISTSRAVYQRVIGEVSAQLALAARSSICADHDRRRADVRLNQHP